MHAPVRSSHVPRRIRMFVAALVPLLLGLVALSTPATALGEKPTIAVSSPSLGARTAGPIEFAGTAEDPDGIFRVVIVAKNLATGLYWDGLHWVDGLSSFDAALESPGATSTPYRADLAAVSDPIWIVVRAVDASGMYSDPFGGQLLAPTAGADAGTDTGSDAGTDGNEDTTGDGTTVQQSGPPEVTLSQPGTSFAGGDLRVGGIALDADGIRRVLVVIKDLDTGQHWNGTAWQVAAIWIDATLGNPQGTNTEFQVALDAPAHRFWIAARAQDGSGQYGVPISVQTTVGSGTPTPTPAPTPTPGPTPVPGGAAALCQGPVRVGVAIDLYSHVASSPAYSSTYDELVANDFCYVSSENSLKRSYIENNSGAQNLSIPDNFVAAAERYGAASRGHALVWNYRDPTYLGDLSTAEVGANMDAFIEQMMTRYPTIDDWDVVNEPLGWNGFSWWAGVYDKLEGPAGFPAVDTAAKTTTAPEYVKRAFLKADDVRTQNGLDTQLWINESNVLDPGSPKYGAKTDVFYNLVAWMVANDIPVDGVGFQGHLRVFGETPKAIWGSTYEVPELTAATAPRICNNLKRFRDLGLDVAITEWDVAIPVNATPAQKAAQIEAYKLIYQISAELGLHDLTIWGTDDGRSFYNKPFTHEGVVGTVVPGWGEATLYDSAMQKKAVYDALVTYAAGYEANPPATRIC